jgi:hypothetical protein
VEPRRSQTARLRGRRGAKGYRVEFASGFGRARDLHGRTVYKGAEFGVAAGYTAKRPNPGRGGSREPGWTNSTS